MSYFDSVITYARKPGFWTCSDRHFHVIKNNMEGDVTALLKKRTVYAMGCWQNYGTFLKEITNKESPKCLYVGKYREHDSLNNIILEKRAIRA